MATLGTYIVAATGLDIIEEALGLIGVYAPGESLDDSESDDALRTLRFMLKAWQPFCGLWLNKELSLFLQDNTISYSLGPTGTHCAENAVKTELAAAAASGATSFTIDATTGFGDTFDRNGISQASTPSGAGSLTLGGDLASGGIATLTSQRKILIYSSGNDSGVTFAVTGQNALGVAVTESITGPNTTTVYSSSTYKTISSITISGAGTGSIEVGQVGDHVGIELDSGTVQWTYLASALSTTITPVTALTGAAAIDNHVYSYTTKIPRPIEIIEARILDSNALETPLSVFGKHDYMLLSNKTTEARPNQIYYDKQLSNGILKVWPEPNDVKEYIKFTGRFPIQDMSLTSTFDVSDEWYEAIAWNLAYRLASKYEKPVDPGMITIATKMLDDAKMYDNENTSIFIDTVTR
jgi:hypothetical protein